MYTPSSVFVGVFRCLTRGGAPWTLTSQLMYYLKYEKTSPPLMTHRHTVYLRRGANVVLNMTIYITDKW